ncbi:hypothetical protein C2E23DRAFT_726077 [Lenzites betulinus]|nr:hypothetical protein C2E23DRAFT_726077 [Lenzites betulinus]
MTEPILFYDIPAGEGLGCSLKCWSPNTWKTRFTLNIKGIPYKTIWVEYPDIEAVLRKIGANAAETKKDGSPYYTLPAIYDPNTKTALAESADIVRYLDKTYPNIGPRLVPAETDALHHAFNTAFTTALMGVGFVLIPSTVLRLGPRSEPYFRSTREVYYGGKLDEIAPPGPKREQYWAGVQKAFSTYSKWLDRAGSPFFLEDKIGYADITVASYMMWFRVILGEDSKEWTELTAWEGGRWAKYLAEFEKFTVVDVGEDVEL